MDETQVDARFVRKSLDRQVEEALVLIGAVPQRWPGGFIAGGRAWTTRELADRLLRDGAAGAEDRAVTIITPFALTARNVFQALQVCGCGEGRNLAALAVKTYPGFGTIAVQVCDRCAVLRRGAGCTVTPLDQVGER